jgi:hypothetical protein
MTHDPHLSQALHEVLSSLSSVRATAAILAETPDLSPEWADRFHQNLYGDSERLASGARRWWPIWTQGARWRNRGSPRPRKRSRIGSRVGAGRSATPSWRGHGGGGGGAGLLCRAQPGAGLRGASGSGCGGLPEPVLTAAVATDGRMRWRLPGGWRWSRAGDAAACGAADAGPGAGRLRRVRHADVSQARARLSLAKVWCGLPALAALRGPWAAACSRSRPRSRSPGRAGVRSGCRPGADTRDRLARAGRNCVRPPC